MQATARSASVVSSTLLARRRLIRIVRLLGGARGIQSFHAFPPTLLFLVAEALGFTGPTVPEDVGSGDVFGFADWADWADHIAVTC